MTDTNRAWGKHLMLDLSGCPLEKIKNRDNILAWNTELIKTIDMVAFGAPFLEYFDNHDPGYTFTQIILTSNITAHFVDTHGGAYIDIFSCKDFLPDDAIAVCVEFFEPKTIVPRTFLRGGEII